MAARGEKSIQILVENTKANAFAKMMLVGESGSIGVPINFPLVRHSNLIWATESLYTTLNQKNDFANQIGKYGYDKTIPDGVFSNNTFVNGF